MTPNQQKFCDEYIVDCNATRAYRIAYPRVKSDAVARSNASRLLTKANVKKYIKERLEEISSTKVATAEEVIEYLTSVMRGKSKSAVLARNCDGSEDVIDKHPDEKDDFEYSIKQLNDYCE